MQLIRRCRWRQPIQYVSRRPRAACALLLICILKLPGARSLRTWVEEFTSETFPQASLKLLTSTSIKHQCGAEWLVLDASVSLKICKINNMWQLPDCFSKEDTRADDTVLSLEKDLKLFSCKSKTVNKPVSKHPVLKKKEKEKKD